MRSRGAVPPVSLTHWRAVMKMLDTMDIPKMRRDTDDPRNIHWLLRNLQANNSEHPDIDEALKALRDLARQK